MTSSGQAVDTATGSEHAVDAAPDLVGFAHTLRCAGVPVPTSRVLAFHEAVHATRPATPRQLYWVGRVTLISRPEHFDAYHRAFVDYFGGGAAGEVPPQPPRPAAPTAGHERVEVDRDGEAVPTPLSGAISDEAENEAAAAVVASELELLRDRRFEDLTAREQASVHAAIRALHVATPRRRSRRMAPGAEGARLDLRRTVRESLATEGELLSRRWRARRQRPRPVVLVLDVSGSMAPYARAMLQFGFAAVRTANPVEVFSVGTRLTRVTAGLTTSDPDRALDAAAALITDWDGGTRIGACLEELLAGYGQRAFLRGAVIVICSDGLERGDPAVLEAQVARLKRMAHTLVWVNPLAGDPRYRPLAGGMAAALPHVDVFLPGHNLASLEQLGAVVGA